MVGEETVLTSGKMEFTQTCFVGNSRFGVNWTQDKVKIPTNSSFIGLGDITFNLNNGCLKLPVRNLPE